MCPALQLTHPDDIVDVDMKVIPPVKKEKKFLIKKIYTFKLKLKLDSKTI